MRLFHQLFTLCFHSAKTYSGAAGSRYTSCKARASNPIGANPSYGLYTLEESANVRSCCGQTPFHAHAHWVSSRLAALYVACADTSQPRIVPRLRLLGASAASLHAHLQLQKRSTARQHHTKRPIPPVSARVRGRRVPSRDDAKTRLRRIRLCLAADPIDISGQDLDRKHREDFEGIDRRRVGTGPGSRFQIEREERESLVGGKERFERVE